MDLQNKVLLPQFSDVMSKEKPKVPVYWLTDIPRPSTLVARSHFLPQRGYVSEEVAEKHKMVELMPGSKVYVYQSDIDIAMKHGIDLKLSSQQKRVVRDGTKMARYVMGLFWSEKELVGRTITPSPRNRDLVPLDINILSTITEFCTNASSNTRAQVKDALRNKVTAANTRAKAKRTPLKDFTQPT